MEADDRTLQLAERLQDISSQPALWRLNGFGCCLLGTLADELLPGLYFKMYWLTALWIPLIPICVYLVGEPIGPLFSISQKLSVSDFHTIYRGRLARFYASVVCESLVTIIAIAIVLSSLVMLTMCTGRSSHIVLHF